MRTALFLLTGFLLLAASFVLGRLFSWTGVAKAGYSFAEELPVFALIFLVPAVAGILARKFIL